VTPQIQGLDEFNAVLDAMIEGLSDTRVANQGFLEPTPLPGAKGNVIPDGLTLTHAVADRFAHEGRDLYGDGAWTGYESEPNYAAWKEDAGGGGQVGVFAEARRPLKRSFVKRTADNIFQVLRSGFRYGSRKFYAAWFHFGGQQQGWDETMSPSRRVWSHPQRLLGVWARGTARFLFAKAAEATGGMETVKVTLNEEV
tara:strand:+ start:1745 stop:2338 length:594 start_codon:yes stop_codon:yes gene_type:complete